MYLYDTRYDKDIISRFPIEGWLFPCYHCGLISSNKIIMLCKKKIINFPVCKHCVQQNQKIIFGDILNSKIKYLSDYNIV